MLESSVPVKAILPPRFTGAVRCGEVARVPSRLFLSLALACALVAGCGERRQTASPETNRVRTSPKSVRITMDALHQLGGVPAGWQLTPLSGDVDAGRALFEELGCNSCHKVAGEKFSEQGTTGPGPELTGMGSHHPPGYFLEAILNPDAVLVDGPGYVSHQGRSTMPVYPDLTVTQLEDLVAYLASLKSNDPHAGHHMMQAGAGGVAAEPNPADRPAPPDTAARIFFAQSYDVVPGKVKAFEEWFRNGGAQRFLAVDGLVNVETFVDATRASHVVTSVWGFRDEAAMNAFMSTNDPAAIAVGTEFDGFVGPHDHQVYRAPPMYRAPALSAP
jgi:mono/diheme cytochrome c family protein